MKILDGQKGKRCDQTEYLTYTHKRCPKCEQVKAVSLFYRKNTKTARGWAWDSYCIDCRRAACQEYGTRSRESRNARLRQWRKKNPVAARKKDYLARIKKKYGLSAVDVEQMRSSQNGECAICREAKDRLFIDHCHSTGRVRALLCQTCNTFLGWYEKKAETILQFQAYLEQHRD